MIEVGVIGEDERSELIEGDLVVMSAKGYAHEMIRKALVRTIVPAAPNDVEVGVEMTVQLAENVLLEPDLALFSQGGLRESRAGFVEVERGGCLLAIEVAVSSLAYDRGLKARLYARHGVQELLGDRRQRAGHLGSHRGCRRALVVDRRARPGRGPDDAGAAELLDQARRYRVITPPPLGRGRAAAVSLPSSVSAASAITVPGGKIASAPARSSAS